jgi:hypothetical protein
MIEHVWKRSGVSGLGEQRKGRAKEDRHGTMVVEDRIRWTSSWDHGIMGSSIITGSNHFTQQDELGNSLTNPL